jgi:DNA-binding transcriptional LysR family regulator
MELRHLRYFSAVAEHLSYIGASRHLHVAQPAISQTILDLEEEIGVKLFQRNKRSVQLTSAGAAFLREVEIILKRSEEAQRVAQRAAHGQVGTLRIGFITSIAPIFLSVVQMFVHRYPEVELELHHLTQDALLAAFDQGTIDLSFSRALPLERRTQFQEELVSIDHLEALLPPKHPLAKAKIIQLEQLASEPFVLLQRTEASTLFDQVVAACHGAGFSPKVRHQPDRMSTVFLLVGCGLGISLVPKDVTGFDRPKTVRRPLSGRYPVRLYVAWPRNPELPTRNTFLDILRAERKSLQKAKQARVLGGADDSQTNTAKAD